MRLLRINPYTLAGIAALLIATSIGLGLAGTQIDGTTDGDTIEGDDYWAYRLTRYDVHEGDYVRFSTSWTSGTKDYVDYAKVLIIEGGEGEGYVETGVGTVIHEQRFDADQPTYFWIKRPDIPSDKESIAGLNGNLYDALDVVLLLERPDGMQDASWSLTKRAFQGTTQNLGFDNVRAVSVDPQYALVPLTLAAIAWMIVNIAVQRKRETPQTPPYGGGDVSALLQLQEMARGYLENLRRGTRLMGVFLIGGAIFGCMAVGNAVNTIYPSPLEWYDGALVLSSLALALILSIHWFMQYRVLRAECKRWDSDKNPLDA